MQTTLLYIYREGEDILWKQRVDLRSLGLELRPRVKNAATIECHECARPLKEIQANEGEWVCYDNEYRCPPCFVVCKASIDARIYRQENLAEKMPRLINEVQQAIYAHRGYKELDLLTKMQFEECLSQRSTANNRYARDLWLHLYHEKSKPL